MVFLKKISTPMQTLDTTDFQNEKVIIRVDFNVPLNEQKEVTDNTRIVAAKTTIETIINKGGSCILLSHLGRPKGVDPELSLRHIVEEVAAVLGREVKFCPQCVGEEAEAAAAALAPGEILLMENLRFHAEETQGDTAFAKQLAALGSSYVNDAFGTAHRAHASTTIIAQFFADKKYFGKLLENEVIAVDKVMKTGEKPVLAILGGAKVSSKITIIENMLDKIDHLLIGGGMVYTFVKAQGGSIGESICEDDYLEYALTILAKAKEKGVHVHLPVDVVAADDFDNNANKKTFPVAEIPAGWQGLDAGPKSLELFKEVVMQSKTILWNGPLGVFEFPSFANGTITIGKHIEASTQAGAFSLVGGGDSVAAVKQFGLEDKMSYISTGGGAMLESLEGKTLPGIAALMS